MLHVLIEQIHIINVFYGDREDAASPSELGWMGGRDSILCLWA